MPKQIVTDMHWQQDELAELPLEKGFRMRGLETTRLDTLIDAAFAFVLSMLVISRGGIPETFQELLTGIKTIPALMMSFLVLMLFWLTHRTWSRRFGMETKGTIVLSVSLVFALLVYVYPLRLLFESMFNALTSGFLPINFTLNTEFEVRGFFAFYSFGFLVMSLLIAGLQFSALKQSKQLCLNEYEIWDTRNALFQWLISSIIAVVSLLLTAWLPLEIIGLAGYVYFSTFAVQIINAKLRAKRQRLLTK